MGTFPITLIVLLVVLEHPSTFSASHLYCFQLFYELRVPFPYTSCILLLWYNHIHYNIYILILVLSCESVRIEYILPTYVLLFTIAFAVPLEA